MGVGKDYFCDSKWLLYSMWWFDVFLSQFKIEMAWCAAVGCENYKRRDSDIAFFGLPKDKEIAIKWKNNLKRGNDIKQIFVCERHFEESCFDPSVDMKNKLMAGNLVLIYHMLIFSNSFLQFIIKYSSLIS